MGEASAARVRVVGLFLLWATVFVASYVAPMMITPEGDGFTRGLNRIGYWFWPQVVAFVLAIVVWTMAGARRAQLSNGIVWLARLPLLVIAAQVLILIAVVIFATMTTPP